ncbi:uncharacterized protein BCR38DRAFT_419772 [Pseudomassariella vexata]|uniref:Uncharacterized protein n=1 Tax=Pseudomassariella vexata TaxID=1141098 RepID=A0A1Y2EFV4_9PEZI|nr:uncharacterized protein BCR38DRAFT_419772 [Pseudomassariella vexata]ORY69675.1 hypothetical protein BCR38DRAFT_419772 [Pseudomassariella vexata]
MRGIITPARGRPGKVTKSVQNPTTRRPAGRRTGQPDSVPNQDPDLDEVGQQLQDEVDHDQSNFDLAAAAAQHSAQNQEIDLSAAAILANNANAMVNPHEHPDLDQHLAGEHIDDGGEPGPHTTESLAHQSGYNDVVVESALAKRLAREPGMRLATQRRPEQVLNLGRRSNVEALFAHIAGETAAVPCKNCHKGHGPWNTCVVVDGQMCGSCANCWFNASGARCSFHETRNPGAHPGGVLVGDGSFNMPSIPPQALGGFNYVSAPASADPVVRYTIERAMADIRAADKKTRQMLLIEAAARELAFRVVSYEEAAQEEQQQQQQHAHDQPPPDGMMNDENVP